MKTDIMPVIVVDGGLKCGGFARFDLAEVLNSNSVSMVTVLCRN
jgi:hypothetical protein